MIGEYTKRARIYPSIFAMLMPALLTIFFLYKELSSLYPNWAVAIRLLTVIVPVTLVYSVIGFFMRETFRSTSKMLFQFPLFKEDETKMPTTRMLLLKDKILDPKSKKHLRELIKTKCGITLYGEKYESENPDLAAKAIVNAVGVIRNLTREDKILLQYNYEFGFARNYLGASIWAFAIIIGIGFVVWVTDSPHIEYIYIALAIQLLLAVFYFVSLKYRANAYARQLFASFETL